MNKFLTILGLAALLSVSVDANARHARGGVVATSLPCSIATSSALNGATVGVAFSQQFAASGVCPSPTWSLSSALIPNTGTAFTLTSGGLYSGTPTTAETESGVVKLTYTGGSVTKNISQVVSPSSPTLAITTSSVLPSATQGVAYSDTLAASGGTSPYTWTTVAGINPNTGTQFSLSSSGVLSGTPGTAETETFTAKVTDSLGATATEFMSLLVNSTSGGGGETQQFNYTNMANAITAGSFKPSWEYTIVGSDFVPNQANHSAGAGYNTTQVNISGGFDVYFNLSYTNPPAFTNCYITSTAPCIAAVAFVVQNSVPSDYSTGNAYNMALTNCTIYGSQICGQTATADANMGGFGAYPGLTNQWPIYHSVAIKFDMGCVNGTYGGGILLSPSAGKGVGCTGLYLSGGPGGALIPTLDMTQSGINLLSGHPFQGHVTYDGTILTLTFRDTTSGAQFRTSWQVNIPSVIGSNSAWVGFTAGIGPDATVLQHISSFQLFTGINTRLPTPTIFPASGQYSGTQTVTIGCPTSANCYYTTNGTVPTTGATPYTGPFSVTSATVVQAVAVRTNYTDSFIAASQLRYSANLINNTTGFTSGDPTQLNGTAILSGTAIQLTDACCGTNEAGSAWYPVQLPVSSGFTTQFQFSMTGYSPSQYSGGIAFCLQNPESNSGSTPFSFASGGPNFVGPPIGGLGFGGISAQSGGTLSGLKQDVCIKFDVNNTVNSTGIYQGLLSASTGSVLITGGATLASGHVFTAKIVYTTAGNNWALTLTDTVTGQTFNYTWSGIVATGALGGTSAYAGFTASTGGNGTYHKILNWTLSSP